MYSRAIEVLQYELRKLQQNLATEKRELNELEDKAADARHEMERKAADAQEKLEDKRKYVAGYAEDAARNIAEIQKALAELGHQPRAKKTKFAKALKALADGKPAGTA